MNEDFEEVLAEHWPRTSMTKIRMVASDLVKALHAVPLNGIEDLRARIPVKTIEFGNAVIEVDANNDVVSVRFHQSAHTNPIY